MFVDTDSLPAREVKSGPLIENPVEAELVAQVSAASPREWRGINFAHCRPRKRSCCAESLNLKSVSSRRIDNRFVSYPPSSPHIPTSKCSRRTKVKDEIRIAFSCRSLDRIPKIKLEISSRTGEGPMSRSREPRRNLSSLDRRLLSPISLFYNSFSRLSTRRAGRTLFRLSLKLRTASMLRTSRVGQRGNERRRVGRRRELGLKLRDSLSSLTSPIRSEETGMVRCSSLVSLHSLHYLLCINSVATIFQESFCADSLYIPVSRSRRGPSRFRTLSQVLRINENQRKESTKYICSFHKYCNCQTI